MKKLIVWLFLFIFLVYKSYSFEPVLLFFSNSPEYVKNNGYLISGTVSPFTPTLIYFYHLNDTFEDKRLYIRFSGKSEAYISYYFSSSRDNYFRVGNEVGAEIFKNFNPQKSYIEDEKVFEVNFPSKYLISGYFWVFSNARIDFESWIGEVNYRYILPLDNKHVKGIFGMSRIVTYLPNDLDYLVVGDIPLDGIETNMLLKGTYKVFYHFVLNRQVKGISFSARGGPSIPIYYISSKQGDFIYTGGGVFKPYDDNVIFSSEIFIKDFLTQPLGACYYPVYYKIKK
ncbi:MAG: hypothetical protein ACK4GR_03390 [bacterium]